MKCTSHRYPDESCVLCVETYCSRFSSDLLMLGPRTAEQARAIEVSIQRVASWFKMDMCKQCILQDDGSVIHEGHLFVNRIKENCLEITLLDDAISICSYTGNKTNLESVFKSQYATQNISVVRRKDGKILVRAKSRLGIYDKDTLIKTIEYSGLKGLSRSKIVEEYENAYIDLEDMIRKGNLFATSYNVWHKKFVTEKCNLLYEKDMLKDIIPFPNNYD